MPSSSDVSPNKETKFSKPFKTMTVFTNDCLLSLYYQIGLLEWFLLNASVRLQGKIFVF